ncbi:MAG: SPASM domain-containing protein [Clostridiales bacterium]|nr:SPASM domain-containing protein [Clostridiales bacterium]
MPAASILIKPASANCNMDCRYCFYKCLSSNRTEYDKGFMTDETLEQLVKGAIDYADGFLTFAFQGGEPTLCGIEFYRKVLAQLAAGYPAEECGMNGCCSCYFVTEGNGDVYPCDFYCSDEWRLGTVADSFEELVQCERAKRFVEISLQKDERCQDCSYFSLCRGGCRRWREQAGIEQAGIEKPGRNRLCEAYRMLFAHAGV